MLARITAAFFLSVAVSSAAWTDETACYWNAPGLPYSIETPPGTGQKLRGSPREVTLALQMHAPGLVLKWACGVVDEEDLANARDVYQNWGCTPESSLGRMVEGLANGGIFVSEIMTAFPVYFNDHAQELVEFCRFIGSIPAPCSEYLASGGDEKFREIREIVRKHPECASKLPEWKTFADTLSGIFRLSPALNEIAARDRALLESAGLE